MAYGRTLANRYLTIRHQRETNRQVGRYTRYIRVGTLEFASSARKCASCVSSFPRELEIMATKKEMYFRSEFFSPTAKSSLFERTRVYT